MKAMDKNYKRLYDETASLIVNLHVQMENLSAEEMYCLLSILDLALMSKDDCGLLQLLREWQDQKPDKEIDDIIKATLINLNFADLPSEQKNIEIIRGLIGYNKNLGNTDSQT